MIGRHNSTSSKCISFAICCLVIILSLPGQSMGFCAFTEPILQTTGLSRNLFSTIYMCATMLGCCGVLVSGPLIDRLGVKKSLIFTLPIWTLTLLMFGMCDKLKITLGSTLSNNVFFTLFFTSSIFMLRLLGQNILPLLGRLEVVRIFPEHQGLAIASCVFFVSICNGITPAFMNWLAQNNDWQHAFRTLSFSGAILFFVVVFFLTEEPIYDIKHDESHEKNDRYIHLEFHSRTALLKTSIFWCITSALCLNAFIGSGTVVHIVDIFRERNVSASAALNSYIPLSIATVTAGFIFGKLVDLNRLKTCLILMFLSQFFGLTGLSHVEYRSSIILYIICIGGTWGGYGVLLTTAWSKIFDQKHIGNILGLVYFLSATVGALSVPLMSLFKYFFGSYFVLLNIIRVVIILCIIFCILKFPKQNTNRGS
ncbi:MAG: MFS transporter [Opitutales bacterium]|nr:MFS transporter [Opitutales bacterium]